jgi:hypothetical protein
VRPPAAMLVEKATITRINVGSLLARLNKADSVVS